ncbi:hypothetical protein BZA05DRAFT_381932 [Tricharina praecox]|uniref:uncharacterized protein n=1 Tax=Tricharina praecox TaxID=43433 RepID=UPI00221FA147|nr:uncharacterized protein BZA05DRAFT_381932 [Tricharina praecox]KAI5858623.1 hypothetical protein BZA05DRAFT_381932 [Tricharina praecox]
MKPVPSDITCVCTVHVRIAPLVPLHTYCPRLAYRHTYPAISSPRGTILPPHHRLPVGRDAHPSRDPLRSISRFLKASLKPAVNTSTPSPLGLGSPLGLITLLYTCIRATTDRAGGKAEYLSSRREDRLRYPCAAGKLWSLDKYLIGRAGLLHTRHRWQYDRYDRYANGFRLAGQMFDVHGLGNACNGGQSNGIRGQPGDT